jgi:hypothetical protein
MLTGGKTRGAAVRLAGLIADGVLEGVLPDGRGGAGALAVSAPVPAVTATSRVPSTWKVRSEKPPPVRGRTCGN